MYPLVAVKSFGKEKTSEIIAELIKANGDLLLEPISLSMDSYDLTAFKLVIVTRYYTAPVLLFECSDLNIIPEAVKKKMEGCIFYFDANDSIEYIGNDSEESNDRYEGTSEHKFETTVEAISLVDDICTYKHFLTELNSLVKFVNDNHVEVSTLITRDLSENNKDEISYDEVKDKCHLSFSIIDLNSKSENDEVDGFAEVLELLKNHVWSTVNISSQTSNELHKLDEDDANVEEALNEFEDLLSKFQQFKDISPNLCREEVLKYAENLADLFANLLNED